MESVVTFLYPAVMNAHLHLVYDSLGQRRTWLSALCVVIGACAVAAALESQDERSLRKGRQIFHQYCAGCHSAQGQGDGYRLLGPAPADLTSRLTQEKADENLLQSIHAGRPNMPSWNNRLTATEHQDVLAYIRSLVK
jgi:mono/diheme cytochrome c family protein